MFWSSDDVTATWKIEGATEERDGETYMRIKHFRVSPKVGDMKIYASGLIPDEGLSKYTVVNRIKKQNKLIMNW